MKAKKVLFITQEITPYVPESDLATCGRQLPQFTQEAGREIRTFMPKWGNINERRNQLHEVIRLSGMNLIIDDTDHPLIIKVASIPSARMQVYFIDSEDFFLHRQMATDEGGAEYADNDERAIFYARGVLETVKKLRWCPEVIHCQGWMSALVGLYVKKAYCDEPSFRDSKVIYSTFGNDFQSPVPANFGQRVSLKGLTDDDITMLNGVQTCLDMEKVAIAHADGFIEHSKDAKKELTEYAQSLNIPTLTYQDDADAFKAACSDFYDEIWSIGKE